MPSTTTLITILSVALVASYSVLATMSSGELTSVAWPMLVVAIALPIWHEARTDANKTSA